MAESRSGRPCLSWATVMVHGLINRIPALADRYCRYPGLGSPGPSCLVKAEHGAVVLESCDIPRCGEH